MAKKKYYVIWKGRKTGIFTDWNTCKVHIDGFKGAEYKSFKTLADAEVAFGESSSSLFELMNEGTTKEDKKKSPKTKNGIQTYTAKEIEKRSEEIKIFTDGGCEPNPGEAGSGVAVYRENKVVQLWYGMYNPKGTNNTAELNALCQALYMAEKLIAQERTVAILCDSKYSIQCITEWAIGWEKKGWKRKHPGDLKNAELIKGMYHLYTKIKDSIAILHVNGHVGVEGNELADRMSMYTIEKKEKAFVKYTGGLNVEEILDMKRG